MVGDGIASGAAKLGKPNPGPLFSGEISVHRVFGLFVKVILRRRDLRI